MRAMRNMKGYTQLKVGVKHDDGKIPLGLVSTEAMEQLGKVLGMGLNKYSAHNWRAGIAWQRVINALMRHLLSFNAGIDIDPESGVSHMAHVMCCAMFILEYEKTHKELDDRYKYA